MGRMNMVEDSLHTQRELNQQLQKRLSMRHQENRLLRKEIFREQQSARIAHEVADAVERQLADLDFAYQVVSKSHAAQAQRIRELENQSIRTFLRTKWEKWFSGCLTSDIEYYGVWIDPAFKKTVDSAG